MMPMDSASRRFKCCDSVYRVWASMVMRASCGQWHGIQGPARDEERVAEIRLAVGERLTARGEHLAASGCQHRVSGGRVPFHGGAQARIEVGLAGSDQAELQRGADGHPVLHLVMPQV